MFGNILIDKLRFSVKTGSLVYPFEAMDKLNSIMSEHFRDKHYCINFSKSYFRLDFNPTLYLDSVEATEGMPVLNLEMISEQKLSKLLKQIYSVLGDNAVVTWIDLTKNILTLLQPLMYIKAMRKRQFKYPYKINDCTSQSNNTTLILSPVKRKDDGDYIRNTNRQIGLYAKIEQLRTKTRTPFVDNVWLSEEEISQIPETNYDRKTGRLWLSNRVNDLHILRCEQRYKYTMNIRRITHYLTGEKDTNELTIPILIALLEQGTLYQKLDEFFTNELRRYVFFDDIQHEKDIKLNKQEQGIVEKMLRYDIDINTYEQLFTDIGQKNQFKYTTKKILYHTIGQYYEELYEKFGIDSQHAAPELDLSSTCDLQDEVMSLDS